MKKLSLVLGCLFLSSFAWCSENTLPLDKVVFQLSAKNWVSTKSALVTVNINAVLNNTDLTKARNDILQNLNQLATGDVWHITQFDRSQDSSGLEKLIVEAKARLTDEPLSQIYAVAKKVSKPGATYTINSIEFKPDLTDIQNVKNSIREQLYQQVNNEVARLNKIYPAQHYSVNRLYIIDGELPSQTPRFKQSDALMLVQAPVSPIAVDNQITLSAIVEVASNHLQGTPGANQ